MVKLATEWLRRVVFWIAKTSRPVAERERQPGLYEDWTPICSTELAKAQEVQPEPSPEVSHGLNVHTFTICPTSPIRPEAKLFLPPVTTPYH